MGLQYIVISEAHQYLQDSCEHNYSKWLRSPSLGGRRGGGRLVVQPPPPPGRSVFLWLQLAFSQEGNIFSLRLQSSAAPAIFRVVTLNLQSF